MARDRPWRLIAADLRRAIGAGEYEPGDRLPTGAELMERYGVARQTVQNAIEQLRSEGLITSTPGGRVQVRARRPIQRLARNRLSREERSEGPGTFLTDAAAGQWRPEVDVTLRAQAADADLAQELRIAGGSEVFVRDRVMRADGVPVQLATSYLPRDLTRGTLIEQQDTGPGGIYARLEEAGHQLSYFIERVRTSAPDDVEAAELDIGRGEPVLRITRVAYGTDRALELNHIVVLAERFELVYELPAD
jgi:GntR family transcriptional regulator